MHGRINFQPDVKVYVTGTYPQVKFYSFDDSQSDETYDDAESYVEIPDILTSMEYLSKVKNFVLHKGYTNVLPDKTAVEEKLEYIFLKEKHSACQIASTDYFEYKWMTSVCNLSF